MNLVERTKKDFQDRNEIIKRMIKKVSRTRLHLTWRPSLARSKVIYTVARSMELNSNGIEWVKEAARMKCDARKCVFSSHDPISVNIEAKCSKRAPNERSLCLASRSLSLGSILGRFIVFRSLTLSDHHDFILRFVFLFRFFIHAWDPGATENKSVTNGLTD